MILPLSGSNQIIDVVASDIRVTVKRRKEPSLSSDALSQQQSKIEIWGKIEKLNIAGNECGVSGENYALEETEPLFFEQSDYIVSAKSLKNKPLYFEHANKHIREAITTVDDDEPNRLTGVINFGNDVGYSNLIFYDSLGNRLLIEIEVFPSKLSYKDDYELIRNDINEMVEGAVIDFINSTYSLGTTCESRTNVPAIFFTLINQLFDKYYRATKVIMQSPTHKLLKKHIVVPSHKLKQTDSKTILWLEKHPEQISCNNGKKMFNRALGVQKTITYDTTENQLVKFMFINTVKQLLKFKRMYLASFKEPDKMADSMVVERIDDMVSKISGQLKNPIFSDISRLKDVNTMISAY